MLLLIAFLALSLLSCTASSAKFQRENAFVGYREGSKAVNPQETCQDLHKNCGEWYQAGECILNPTFMRNQCPLSCKACLEDRQSRDVIHGHATPEGTKHFSAFYPAAAQHSISETHFRYDPSMGDMEFSGQGMRLRPWLMLSSLGVGTYLGSETDAEDEKVTCGVIESVGHGINVIDTARNYRQGRGERSVGAALAALKHGGVARNTIFVSTKAGFVPSGLLSKLQSARKVGKGDVAGGNCIHPACIRGSLDQSLAALCLATVDLLYLHNAVETQLPAVGRPVFMQRLLSAFKELELLRKEGRIRSYGLATWSCFRVAPSSSTFISLQDVVDLAIQAGGLQHGFRYVQLPMNVHMREAWQQPWQQLRADKGNSATQGRMLPFTEAAAMMGVGVMASGSLGEGRVLEDRTALDNLIATPQLELVREESPAVGALLLVKSTPYVITALVGMKRQHVADNLKVTKYEVLRRQEFWAAFGSYPPANQQEVSRTA